MAATPSASSRTSSPHSRSDAGSPYLGTQSITDRGVQTEPEDLAVNRATVLDLGVASLGEVLPPGRSTSSGPGPRRRLPAPRPREDLEIWDPEQMKAVTAELFQRHDANKTGHLAWQSGEVMAFLNDFFMRHDFPPPKLPTAVFSNLYNQVKTDSGRGDVEGLSVSETADFAKRVHDFMLTNRGLRGEMREQRRSATASGVGGSPMNTASSPSSVGTGSSNLLFLPNAATTNSSSGLSKVGEPKVLQPVARLSPLNAPDASTATAAVSAPQPGAGTVPVTAVPIGNGPASGNGSSVSAARGQSPVQHSPTRGSVIDRRPRS